MAVASTVLKNAGSAWLCLVSNLNLFVFLIHAHAPEIHDVMHFSVTHTGSIHVSPDRLSLCVKKRAKDERLCVLFS